MWESGRNKPYYHLSGDTLGLFSKGPFCLNRVVTNNFAPTNFEDII